MRGLGNGNSSSVGVAQPSGSIVNLPMNYTARLPIINFMPPEGQPFDVAATVALPAVGATVVVAQVTVPTGLNGVLHRIANEFIGGGFVDGSGDIIWQIFQNLGQVGGTGVVAPYYDNIINSLGTVPNPSEIDGIRVQSGAVLAITLTNVAVVVAKQLVRARLGGYWYPIGLEPQNLSF